jgi:pentatricopeptide repeat protein
MIALHKQTDDPLIAPSNVSFNTCMNAWSKSWDPSAHENAEKIFQQMTDYHENDVKPDVLSFSTLLDTYSRSRHPNAVERAEELFEMMDELGVQRNVYTYSALQKVHARSGRPDAADLCLKVLERMLQLYRNGDIFAKPNCVNYNSVLHAYSRTNTRKSADRANDMLEKMEMSDFDGGYDVEPDRLSYALTILACGRCPDALYGSKLSEANLEKMEKRAEIEAKKRKEISSAAPASVTLDLESFNVVLTATSKSRHPDSALRAIRIVKRMEEYAKQGHDFVAPNVRSWNAILHCFSRSNEEDRGERSEQILNHMFELHQKGVKNVKPDAFSFAAVLSTYQRLKTPLACQRCDDIVRHMEELYEKGELEQHPDVFHYTILCTAWARSNQKRAAPRVVEILSMMKEKHRAGVPHIKPNVRTYDSCLDALCRAGDVEKAEQLLYHMLALARDGDKEALPDSFSFNCVISGFTRSRRKDAAQRAESVLDRFLEFSEEFPSVRPDTRSFTHIIAHYARQKEMLDSPYRAEYALNRLISFFQADNKNLAPNVFAFTTVMDAYALHNHKDAGEKSEQLVRTMLKLKRQYDMEDLEINTGVMNNVLNAWSFSDHENAGYRADAIVNDMENRCDEEGELGIQPNARTYSLLLTIWSKMKVGHKAERALEILNHMKERSKRGKLSLPSNDLSHSIVINACAFTKGDTEVEERAFQIAVQMMTELLRGDNPSIVPTSTTFGWFFQACRHLKVDKALKEENLERYFSTCCEMGLVNDFVLDRFKEAASDQVLQKMMGTTLSNLMTDDTKDTRSAKERLALNDLPPDWRRKPRKQYTPGNEENGDSGHGPKRRKFATRGKVSRNNR